MDKALFYQHLLKKSEKGIFMKSYFSWRPFFTKPQDESEEQKDLLLADIRKTQNALETAYQGFDNATDPDLIDCYIFEVNSALKRYRFLIGQAQRMHILINDSTDYAKYPRLEL